MDKAKQPGIKFDGIILVEEAFWRDHIVPEDIHLKINFEVGRFKTNGGFNVELETTLKMTNAEKEVVSFISKFVGFFSVIHGEENMDIEEYIKNNAPALMFPYIREHISSVTTKAGIRPVHLPPINLVALLDKEVSEE